MPTYGLALGSNLGDRHALITQARDQIEKKHPGKIICAPLYETSPVDCPEGSPPFLNTVIEIESHLPPHSLLSHTQEIEKSLGRPSKDTRLSNAPRPVDIDLLYADEILLETASLTIPHPRLHLRRFVLQPLADIRPNLVLPGFTETTSRLLTKLQTNEPPLTHISKTW